jgi:parallel beta-helix repeat protein
VGLFLRNNDAYILFENLEIDCNSVANTNGAAVFAGSHHIRFSNLNIHHCDFDAVYVSEADNVEILGGRMHDITFRAIGADGTVDGLVIQDVIIDNNTGAGIDVPANSGTASNLVVAKNVIHHNTGLGVDLGSSVGGLIQNNIVYRNNAGTQIRTGASGTKVYQNTFANNTTFGLQCDSGATGVSFINNISYDNASNLNNNCSATIASNVITDPTFANSAGDNYNLAAGSIAYNTGVTLPSVTTDQAGVARPKFGLYDVGALESLTDLTPGVPGGDVTVLERVAEWRLFFF